MLAINQCIMKNLLLYYVPFYVSINVYFVRLSSCSTSLSFECQQGYFLLGKPKKQHLKKEFREALNTFLACRGLPLLADTEKVNVYLRLKMKRHTITSTSYDRANTTCSYTVEYCDSSGQSQLGDVCCYVHYQDSFVAIVKQYRTVPGFIISYEEFNLVKHMSRVLCSNAVVVIKLEELKQICIKMEMSAGEDLS